MFRILALLLIGFISVACQGNGSDDNNNSPTPRSTDRDVGDSDQMVGDDDNDDRDTRTRVPAGSGSEGSVPGVDTDDLENPIQTALIFKESDGVAVQGADVVAYYSLDESDDAVLGDTEFSHDWQGATWLFSSEENRDLFADNPLRYAPQFGGYCAYAASQGYLFQTDVDAWTVVDDKLYLNASKGVRSNWLEDIEDNIEAGEENWPDIVADETN